MEARVGVVVEGGGQRALSSGHGSAVLEGGAAHKLVAQQRSLQRNSQIGTIPQLLAGGVAGAVSKTCTAPLARLTILFQVQGMHSDVATLKKTSIWREASRIVGEEGFRAFWKGNLLLQLILGLEGHSENLSTDLCIRLVGGGLAGITAASVTYPLDLIRTRLAAQTNVIYYRGIGHALSTISREEGIFGLYKGLGATLLGVGPSLAISFSVYDTLRSYWQSQRPDDSPALVSLACGSLSGIASSTATFPLDLVRRRKQLEGAGGQARVYNTGLFGTFRHIFQAEGLRGLYRGILPEYYKVVPSVGIAFMTYEKLKQILSDIPAN
ncbi:uncharacterized protein LOC132312096 isoform X2 [Cornus florida]|uniref:uncharacterized protein LOC132312096 isoform X2 n=1 Tax=Cornus florida TaxID=4283 RepID=UPI00289CDFF9|nr:uncharacterized protein LOC132312096 isoform X2 [Cornus florida]